ncbi:MAG: helix-turn-helix transcriptional regulator [Alphaproteobacteria bacterium]|nr:helix-turn-helix transcriptional regulator [Alphaproteobacteria bacterium]
MSKTQTNDDERETSNVVNIEWFRKALKKSDLHQKDLGDALNASGQTMTNILQGRRAFRANEIAKAAKCMDMPALFVLAAATNELDLEAEIKREAETVEFACEQADELIRRSGKVFDEERRRKLISVIYKMARKHQVDGDMKDLGLDTLEFVLSMVK